MAAFFINLMNVLDSGIARCHRSQKLTQHMQAAAKESTVFPKYLQMILFCCGISLGTATLSRAADATGSVQRPEKPPGDAPRVSVPVIDLLNAKLNGKEIFGLSPES